MPESDPPLKAQIDESTVRAYYQNALDSATRVNEQTAIVYTVVSSVAAIGTATLLVSQDGSAPWLRVLISASVTSWIATTFFYAYALTPTPKLESSDSIKGVSAMADYVRGQASSLDRLLRRRSRRSLGLALLSAVVTVAALVCSTIASTTTPLHLSVQLTAAQRSMLTESCANQAIDIDGVLLETDGRTYLRLSPDECNGRPVRLVLSTAQLYGAIIHD